MEYNRDGEDRDGGGERKRGEDGRDEKKRPTRNPAPPPLATRNNAPIRHIVPTTGRVSFRAVPLPDQQDYQAQLDWGLPHHGGLFRIRERGSKAKGIRAFALRHRGGEQRVELHLTTDRGGLREEPSFIQLRDATTDKIVDVPIAELQQHPSCFDSQRVYSINVDALLSTLGAPVNQNLIYATAIFASKSKMITVEPLHVVKQQALLLLPGVLATTLRVRGGEGEVKGKGALLQAWPPPPTAKLTHLSLLECHPDGTPVRPAMRMKFIEKADMAPKKAAGIGPYVTRTWEDRLNAPFRWELYGEEHYGQGKHSYELPVPYIYLQEYPYDWRLAAQQIVDALLGDEQVVEHQDAYGLLWMHRTPSKNKKASKKDERSQHAKTTSHLSIKSILTALRKHGQPFLDDKVAVMGHSTGGVILNGLIRDARAAQVIDAAFFVGTPFLGAPKAYRAFLCGGMDFDFTQNTAVWDKPTFVSLACNVPVIYHLAPTKELRTSVFITDENGEEETSISDDPVAAMDNLISLMQNTTDLPYDKSPWLRGLGRRWSRDLHRQAEDYHKRCAESDVQIPVERCLVFFTLYSKGATHRHLAFDARDHRGAKPTKRRLTGVPGEGDKTVPLESLRGAKDLASQHRPLKADVEHVEIMADLGLWRHVGAILRPPLGVPDQEPTDDLLTNEELDASQHKLRSSLELQRPLIDDDDEPYEFWNSDEEQDEDEDDDHDEEDE